MSPDTEHDYGVDLSKQIDVLMNEPERTFRAASNDKGSVRSSARAWMTFNTSTMNNVSQSGTPVFNTFMTFYGVPGWGSRQLEGTKKKKKHML